MTTTAPTGQLLSRIQAEFDAREKRAQAEHDVREEQSEVQEQRLVRFAKVCDELSAIWRPRLEAFIKYFGEKLQVTPKVEPSRREMSASFRTDLADMRLTISASASPDSDVVLLEQDLRILPIFFDYERTASLRIPFDAIDRDAIAAWLDDRLVACAKAYLEIQDNEHYLRRAIATDPVTRTRFSRLDAVGSVEYDGRTYYFASENSLKSFKEEHGLK